MLGTFVLETSLGRRRDARNTCWGKEHMRSF